MSIFKAYDIRGLYPGELNEKTAFAIGLAVSELFRPEVVAVGHDARASSEPITAALIDALLRSNARVIDIGLVSTPMLYHYAGSLSLPLGLMVTASHNGAQYNGFKLCRNGARPVTAEQIAAVGEWVQRFSGNGSPRAPRNLGRAAERVDPFPEYERYVRGFARFRPGVKIAVDTANAICGMVIPRVFSALPVDIVPLFFELDGRFPNHEPDPLKQENTRALQQAVIEHRCLFGAALDGDGDRVIFIDERGRYVPADIATLLIALDVIDREAPPKKVVIDTRMSKAVVEVLGKLGVEVIRGRVGHSYVKAKIHETGAVFGGELSGHYYFRESFFAENSDVAIIAMLNIFSQLGHPLSALVDEYSMYFHSGEINFLVDDKERMLDRIVGSYRDAKVSHIDGVTVEYPSWWFNVRPSNTENVLRLNLEADTRGELDARRKEVVELIAGLGGSVITTSSH